MLLQILRNLGFSPTKEASNGYQYKSPFNPQERTPSFFVFRNSKSGEYTNFKDYSSGAGGDTYKFIMSYFHIDFKSAKNKISELIGSNVQEPSRPIQNTPPIFSFNQHRETKKEESVKIVKSQPLQNVALLNYISERGISVEIAKQYLGEIYYKIDKKSYFALSFLNDVGGREIRNKYFKGSLGTKGTSFIKHRPSKTLKIFEGFIDFLSYQRLADKSIISHYLVLNSASLREQALKQITANYEEIHLYLDNDKAGDETTQFFINNLGENRTNDKRKFYTDFKDVNEFLMSKIN